MSSNDINDWYNSFLSIEKEDHDINIIKEFENFLEATPLKSSKKLEQSFKKFKKTYE